MRHVNAHHCNTIKPTAIHCNTLQHTATHCITLQHTATHRKMNRRHWRETATRHNGTNKVRRACGSLMARGTPPLCLLTDYNMLQHTTTRCNTLQQSTTRCNTYLLWQEVLRTHCNTLQPLSMCCPPKKKIDNITPKNQSTMRGKRGKAAHKMCEDPCLTCGCLMG